MPFSNEEARLDLERKRADRDLTLAWIARRLGKNIMWVQRRLNGDVEMSLNDYALLKIAIESVPPKEALFLSGEEVA